MNKNYIITIFGMSGVGKTYLQHYLAKQFQIPRLITHTTRKPRLNEKDGVDYYFDTKHQFAKLDLIESTKYDNNYYGSAYPDVINNWRKGNHIISTVLDYHGVDTYSSTFPKQIVPVYLDCPVSTVIHRLEKRGMPKNDIKSRLKEHQNDSSAEQKLIFNPGKHVHLISTFDWSDEKRCANELIYNLTHN